MGPNDFVSRCATSVRLFHIASELAPIESRMFVKGGLGFGVVGVLRWPRVARPFLFRSGIGGHDRDESLTGGGAAR